MNVLSYSNMILGDTICAPATPPVNSAIAIIRISGPQTCNLLEKILSVKGKLIPRRAYFLSIIDESELVDDVITIYYHAPNSYTGEDMAEIYCHGNQLIVKNILQLLQKHGLRMAQPGEFTRLSFLNGKIDLTEAEAINHLITATSDWEISTAIDQMHGSLRARIDEIRNEIILFKADVECGIDFIEEDVEILSVDSGLDKVDRICGLINDCLIRCKIGERLSHGIDITITGKPNVGKSSILNLLLNRYRAIVSDIPGTTRDVIKEPIQINGVHFNIIDTAGIDVPANEIEKIGIELSYKNIDDAAIVIMVFDASTGIDTADKKIYDHLKNKNNCIYLINKCDIGSAENIEFISGMLDRKPLIFSSKEGIGLNEFKDRIIDSIKYDFVDIKNTFIADSRIIALLEESLHLISDTKNLIKNGEPVEIIASDINGILEKISDITGEITPDQVLDSIFSRFCIGK